jgi:hypothetical protein
VWDSERRRCSVRCDIPEQRLSDAHDRLVAICERFTQRDTWGEIRDLYDLTGAARNLQARLQHRADTDTIDVVKAADGGATELVPVRWGLIPY